MPSGKTLAVAFGLSIGVGSDGMVKIKAGFCCQAPAKPRPDPLKNQGLEFR
jgi:hypothetical protein